MIIPVWKKIGESTHQLAKKVGDYFNTKATHTGTLDPMAEGVVIVLTSEDRYKKELFSNVKKKYVFDILIGVQTDSYDTLGLVNSTTNTNLDLHTIKNSISNILPKIKKIHIQTQPLFSAQRVNGKSAFDLAKQKKSFDRKKNKIQIHSITLVKAKKIPLNTFIAITKKRVALVSGAFRQKKIIKKWQETILKLKKNNIDSLPLIKINATVSKRTYIRSITEIISKELKLPATTFHIIRTQNGNFKKVDTKNLIE